jgi:hypothetical protein
MPKPSYLPVAEGLPEVFAKGAVALEYLWSELVDNEQWFLLRHDDGRRAVLRAELLND